MDEGLESKSIAQIGHQIMDARNRLDAKGVAAFYADDAEFMNVKGNVTKGRMALEKSLRSFYSKSFVQKTRQVVESTSVKFVHPAVASLDIRWRTEGALDITGQPRRGVVNAILVKDSSNDWKIKVSHNTELIEAETSTVGQALDRERVQEMAVKFSEDFQRGDYKAMAAYFADDATYFPVGQPAVHGRRSIEEYWRTAKGKGVNRFEVNVDTVESAGKFAYEVGNALAHVRSSSGSGEVKDAVRYIVVWKLEEDGMWRILLDISNRSKD